MKPNYIHDCKRCQYIGTTIGHHIYDWYYCEQQGMPTIVSRHGDDGASYDSIPTVLLEPALPLYKSAETQHASYAENNLMALGALTLYRRMQKP